MVKKIEKMSIRELRSELSEARSEMIKINQIIYAAGAPLGSDNYFKIREIVARYERDEHERNRTDKS